MKRIEVIRNFLRSSAGTHADLAVLYNGNMEVQLNVGKDGGQQVGGEFNGRNWVGYTDGIQTWKSFRIPYKADTVPEYQDVEMNFDIEEHTEGIGMTGWDWQNRLSRWVAYDFDSITTHSGTGLSGAKLEEVQKAMYGLDYVTIRKSTSGNGLHVYVFLEPVETENHTEHAALARAILSKMSLDAGYDFNNAVDVCGGNMWVWHRKMKKNPEGLKLIKQGCSLQHVPLNWRDHKNVISGQSRKVRCGDIPETVDELAGKHKRVPLDAEHKALIEWLTENQKTWWWVQDHHMLVCHTADLKTAHGVLGMRGVFSTVATGSIRGDHNCFCFPRKDGAWTVRRYTANTAESESWTADSRGFAKCELNAEPTFDIVARMSNAVETQSNKYSLSSLPAFQLMMQRLGIDVSKLKGNANREIEIKTKKDGKMEVTIESQTGDEDFKGWSSKKGKYYRTFDLPPRSNSEIDIDTFDEQVRKLISEDGKDLSWAVKSDRGWVEEPLQHVKSFLVSEGAEPTKISAIIGANVGRPWTVVCKPFQDEYLGDRVWNKNAPQFKVSPTLEEDLFYPTWRRVFEHLGKGLNAAIVEDKWCQENHVSNGGEYLMRWLAAALRQPDQPLPYLFFYGEQKTGKSLFHESLDLLVTSGIMSATNALTSQSGFNGELAGAVFAVIEEIDLSDKSAKTVYNKIKEWVTAKRIAIRKMHRETYMIPNMTHWIHCSNYRTACPVFPNDTRIVYLYVDKPEQQIPKDTLLAMLEKEASDFLTYLLRVEINKPVDRLLIPVIHTADKQEAEDRSMTPVDLFFRKYKYAPGHLIELGKLCDDFDESLESPELRARWSKHVFTRSIPKPYVKGRLTSKQGVTYIGNIAKVEDDVTSTSPYVETFKSDGKTVWLEQV